MVANAGTPKGATSTSPLNQLNQLKEYLQSFDAVTVVDSGEIICDTFPTGTTISQFGKTKDVMNALTQFSQLDNRENSNKHRIKLLIDALHKLHNILWCSII